MKTVQQYVAPFVLATTKEAEWTRLRLRHTPGDEFHLDVFLYPDEGLAVRARVVAESQARYSFWSFPLEAAAGSKEKRMQEFQRLVEQFRDYPTRITERKGRFFISYVCEVERSGVKQRIGTTSHFRFTTPPPASAYSNGKMEWRAQPLQSAVR
jgi:hypothetical protein